MTAALVPELYVNNLKTSLAFYCDVLGFEIAYERPEEKFVYLTREAAEIMLEEPDGRTFLAGPLEPPFGRGINLQILVEDVAALYAFCQTRSATIFMTLETRIYRRRDEMVSQTQFIVQDPDGYLIRLAQTAVITDKR